MSTKNQRNQFATNLFKLWLCTVQKCKNYDRVRGEGTSYLSPWPTGAASVRRARSSPPPPPWPPPPPACLRPAGDCHRPEAVHLADALHGSFGLGHSALAMLGTDGPVEFGSAWIANSVGRCLHSGRCHFVLGVVYPMKGQRGGRELVEEARGFRGWKKFVDFRLKLGE